MRWAAWVVAPLLGVLVMTLPVILAPPARWDDAPLFPVIRTAIERVGPGHLLLLFFLGLGLGLVSRRRAILLGLASMLLFPLTAIAEMFVDPTSHNLWPLEFAIYGFYAGVVAAGAAVAHLVRKRGGAHP
jgi:hypothetical protein